MTEVPVSTALLPRRITVVVELIVSAVRPIAVRVGRIDTLMNRLMARSLAGETALPAEVSLGRVPLAVLLLVSKRESIPRPARVTPTRPRSILAPSGNSWLSALYGSEAAPDVSASGRTVTPKALATRISPNSA